MIKKYRNLDIFEQNIAALYDLDPEKDSDRIKELTEQAVVDYFLTDIHYLVIRRLFAGNKSMSDSELSRIVKKTSISVSEIIKGLLTEEEMKSVQDDISHLEKYNELYSTPKKGYIASAVEKACNGDSTGLMQTASEVSVRRYLALKALGITEHIRVTNRTLDDDLRALHDTRLHSTDRAKQMIDEYRRTHQG